MKSQLLWNLSKGWEENPQKDSELMMFIEWKKMYFIIFTIAIEHFFGAIKTESSINTTNEYVKHIHNKKNVYM